MGFFKTLFSGKEESEEEKDAKRQENNSTASKPCGLGEPTTPLPASPMRSTSRPTPRLRPISSMLTCAKVTLRVPPTNWRKCAAFIPTTPVIP